MADRQLPSEKINKEKILKPEVKPFIKKESKEGEDIREIKPEERQPSTSKEQDLPSLKVPSVSSPTEEILVDEAEVAEVEKILAEDLEDIYLQMSPEKQKIFKAKGEEVAKKIVQILHGAKIKIQTILNLIREWLQLIPGVNKFFIEQEAKIKTDKILQKNKKEKI